MVTRGNRKFAVVLSAAVLVSVAVLPGTAGAATQPGVVGGLHVVARSSSHIDMAWSAPASGDAPTGYAVRWSSDHGASWSSTQLPADASGFDLTQVAPGASYLVTVAATNDAGSGPAAYLGGAVQMSAGVEHLCALDADGVVSCWGSRTYGALGDGSMSGYSVSPVHPFGLGAGNYSISGRSTGTCVVAADGLVRCWGAIYEGDNNWGEIARPLVHDELSPASSVAQDIWGTCAVRSQVLTCRDLPAGIPPPPTDAAFVRDSRCYVSTSAALMCGSFGSYAQIGNAGVSNYSAGSSHNCSVMVDGSVHCWGSNFEGELGDGTTTSSTGTTPTTVVGISDATSVAAGEEDSCASLVDGSVKCWGIPLGAYAGSGSTTPQTVPGIADAIAVDTAYGTNMSPIGEYACALLSTGRISCWGNAYLGADYVTMTRYDLPPAEIVAADAPDVPTGLEVSSHPSPTAMSLTWTPPVGSGGSPVTDYRASWTTDGGVTWSTPADLGGGPSGTVTGLTPGDTYQFKVAAYNDAGWGNWSAPSAPPSLAAAAPAAPTGFSVVGQSGSDVTVGWTAPNDNGLAITGYNVELSADGGQSWSAVDETQGTQADVAQPATPATVLLRVVAVNADGAGRPSATVTLASSTATPAQDFLLQTADGLPVTDGLVSWSAADGSAMSSQPVVPTSNGWVEFGRVIPGAASVHLQNGLLPDGTRVNGDWKVVVGTDQQVLRLPDEPVADVRRIHVVMPNGTPVVGAHVEMASTYPASADLSVRGFRFTVAGGNSSLVADTDANGEASLRSYDQRAGSGSSLPLAITVTYDDSVLLQRQTLFAVLPVTEVRLAYMPWITDDTQSTSPSVGAPYYVTVKLRRSTTSAHVTVAPPPKSTASTCGKAQVLSGTVASGSSLRLRVCPRRSGQYGFSAKGAVPPGALMLRVSGAPPMAPRHLVVTSPRVGCARLAWEAPSYKGGARIKEYRITVLRRGAAASSARHFTTTSLALRVSSLRPGAQYVYTVRAVTRFGVGDGAKMLRRVAGG